MTKIPTDITFILNMYIFVVSIFQLIDQWNNSRLIKQTDSNSRRLEDETFGSDSSTTGPPTQGFFEWRRLIFDQSNTRWRFNRLIIWTFLCRSFFLCHIIVGILNYARVNFFIRVNLKPNRRLNFIIEVKNNIRYLSSI